MSRLSRIFPIVECLKSSFLFAFIRFNYPRINVEILNEKLCQGKQKQWMKCDDHWFLRNRLCTCKLAVNVWLSLSTEEWCEVKLPNGSDLAHYIISIKQLTRPSFLSRFLISTLFNWWICALEIRNEKSQFSRPL